jgi:hypothetical protein
MVDPGQLGFLPDGWLPPKGGSQELLLWKVYGYLIAWTWKHKKVASTAFYWSRRLPGHIYLQKEGSHSDSQCKEHQQCREKELKVAVGFCMNPLRDLYLKCLLLFFTHSGSLGNVKCFLKCKGSVCGDEMWFLSLFSLSHRKWQHICIFLFWEQNTSR